jgi:itaconyl-CoA hydratase
MRSVTAPRPSRSRPAVGIVELRTTGFNRDGVAVIEFLRTIMVYRRGHTPEGFRPRLST